MSQPRQNRVTPWGEVIAEPARGAWLGNRGCIHDDAGRIRKTHQLERWIYCLLEFKGRRRQLMRPGRYTELFFFDEPTALAAGHRPCAECQRERFNEFRALWPHAVAGEHPRAGEIDAALQRERLDEAGAKVTFQAPLGTLPDGSMVAPGGRDAWLLWRGALHEWQPGGYARSRPAEAAERVAVLTPRTTVEVLSRGFAIEPALARG